MTRTALAALAAIALTTPAVHALDVGDPAPPIHAAKWVSNTPVTLESAKGKILIVEFWATWCTPCRRTIPHLNQLFKKYDEKSVVIVGITEEDEPTVKKYMEGMAMDYHVGLDDKSQTNEAYMKGIPGVPHAFVVGKDGKVVWHGHPLAGLDDVLGQLVAGTFDAARSKKLEALKAKLQEAARSRNIDSITAVLDEMIKTVPDDPDAYRIKRAVLRDQGKTEETWPILLDMAKGCAKNPNVLIEVAVTLATAGELEHRDLPRALELAKQAAEISAGANPAILAALARVHYELGHISQAADIAAKAATTADGDDKKRLEAHAAFYRAELARRAKDPDAK